MKLSETTLTRIAWGLSVLVCIPAFYVWGDGFGWQLSRIDTYRLFPLLGLLAFSLMWVHFVMAFLKSVANPNANIKKFYSLTSKAVLLLILLHPGLLLFRLFQDGFGLPPDSYKAYVGSAMAGYAFIGTAALLAFLLYELKPWFEKKRWWSVVEHINNIAILGIVLHSLKLGQHLQVGRPYALWVFYALVLVVCISYSYIRKFSPKAV